MAQVGLAAGRDAKVIALVCVPHMMSHAYFLVLPPLFPLLKAALGVGYTELGFALTVFGIAAGAAQIPVGFLVDRIGGAPLLIGGLALQATAVAMIGLIDAYWQLVALCALSGLAHTVYHPADYAILTASIDKRRLGRAYGVHAFTGNLGFAIAPAFMVTVAELWSWRAAFLGIGALGLAFTLLLAASRGLLAYDTAPAPAADRPVPAGRGTRDGIRLLLSAPILMCFVFFVLQMAGMGGIRSFVVAALDQLFSTPLAVVNTALFGLLAGSALGIIVGADLADRVGPRVGTALLTLGPAAALIVLAGSVPMTLVMLTAVLSAVGFLQGVVLPSRDLLLRSVTPDGAMGKVMGFVSSGANLAGGLVPLAYGWILDTLDPRWIFWISAAFIAVALLTFLTVRDRYAE